MQFHSRMKSIYLSPQKLLPAHTRIPHPSPPAKELKNKHGGLFSEPSLTHPPTRRDAARERGWGRVSPLSPQARRVSIRCLAQAHTHYMYMCACSNSGGTLMTGKRQGAVAMWTWRLGTAASGRLALHRNPLRPRYYYQAADARALAFSAIKSRAGPACNGHPCTCVCVTRVELSTERGR